MRSVEIRIWCGTFLVILGVLTPRGWAGDQIDLPTYVPAPADRLHANRGTIGPPYAPEAVPDSSVPNGNLLVSGNIGIGTTSPRSNPPNTVAVGDLDVNDAYLRSIGRWVSQFGPGGGGPVGLNENSTSIMLAPSEITLATVTITASGRSVTAMGKVEYVALPRDSSSMSDVATISLYRDGSLVDRVVVRVSLKDFGVVMKTAVLTAGTHTFVLRACLLYTSPSPRD